MLDRVGDRTALCETSASAVLVVDFAPIIRTWNVRSRRYDSRRLIRRPGISVPVSLCMRPSFQTRSKAFSTSKRTVPVRSFLWNPPSIFSTTLMVWNSVPSPFRKANWCSGSPELLKESWQSKTRYLVKASLLITNKNDEKHISPLYIGRFNEDLNDFSYTSVKLKEIMFTSCSCDLAWYCWQELHK